MATYKGPLMFKKEDGKEDEIICNVHLKANFPLPKPMAVKVQQFVPDLPELHKSGLCFTMAFNDPQNEAVVRKAREKSFLDLLTYMAGNSGSRGGTSSVGATEQRYAKVLLGDGPAAKTFVMVSPRNPDAITLDFQMRCYQPVSALRPLPPVVPQPAAASPFYGYPYPPPTGSQPQPPPANGGSLPPANDDSTADSSGTNDVIAGVGGGQQEPDRSHQAGVDRSIIGTMAQAHPHVFGAIAELVDNSWDQAATEVEIGIVAEDPEAPYLCVKDNGNGMTNEGIRRMLNMGHKRDVYNKSKLGKYGVGFKSGSMRIGKTAIVFTCSGDTCSVGLLSQVLKLENPNDRSLETPIVTYRKNDLEFDRSVQTEAQAQAAQDAITSTTKFSVRRLIMELGKIEATGTMIYITDLNKRTPTESNPHPFELQWKKNSIFVSNKKKQRRPGNHALKQPIDWNLKKYMELLYAGENKKFEIRVQGRYVPRGSAFEKGYLRKISKVYKKKFPMHYDPEVEGLDPNAIDTAKLLFGYNEDLAKDNNSGVCIYWRSRMITAFDTMDMMNEKDFGIMGIASTGNILNPLNNKQAFDTNVENFGLVEQWIKECFRDYKEQFYGEDIKEKTDNMELQDKWAFCDKCGKARRLPPGMHVPDDTDEPWYCWYLPKSNKYYGCSLPEEEQDDSEITVGVTNAGKRITASSDFGKKKKQRVV